MQRAAFDLVGIASDSDDQRPWLWQASWPIDQFPLRRDFAASPKWEPGEEDYPFVRVAGDGVHEIPVGPVHAGIIEPGHFRFQIVGEKVLRLEERLGYVHKGIEKRFEALPLRRRLPAGGARLGRQHRRLRLGLRAGGSRRSPASPCRRARVAARAGARARAHRQPPGRPRLPRQRRRLRVRPRAVLAAEGGRAAHQPRGVRPPAADGRGRAGRRRARPRRRKPPRRCATSARGSSARSACCATSTTTTPGCRTASAPAAA